MPPLLLLCAAACVAVVVFLGVPTQLTSMLLLWGSPKVMGA